MFQFFASPFFQFEFLRVLAMTPFEGGEINEILLTATRIRDQDPNSWFDGWTATARKVESIAREAERSGDRPAARRAYLRAANYLRAAQFMLTEVPGEPHSSSPAGLDPRALPTLEQAIANFRRGVALLDGRVVFLDIPYEKGLSLPGYLYLPPAHSRLPQRPRGPQGPQARSPQDHCPRTPVLVNVGGGDSTQEEIYFINASTGPALGYAVLTFDGPGQGIVLRRDALPMRHDFEAVVARVLDYLWDWAAAHPDAELDLQRVAITGASMGGYFALRGATDPRVRACVCVDGFYSMESFARGRVPGWLWGLFRAGRIPDAVFDAVTGLLSWWSFQTRWELSHMRRALGISPSPSSPPIPSSFSSKNPAPPSSSSPSPAAPPPCPPSPSKDNNRVPSSSQADPASTERPPSAPTLTSNAALMRRMLDFTLLRPDGTTLLRDIHCSVLVTGAASSFYFDPETTTRRILRGLAHLPDDQRHEWIATDEMLGGLQAKIGAFGYAMQRTFAFLDEQFGVERTPLRSDD